MMPLLLATSWQGRSQGARLVVACALTSAWAGVLAHAAWTQTLPVAQVTLAEFARDAAWLVVLGGLIERAALPRLLSRLAYLLAGGAVVVGAALALSEIVHGTAETAAAAVLIFGGLGLSLVVLILLEQLYRNSTT